LKYKNGEKSLVFKAKDAKERSDWVSLINLREMPAVIKERPVGSALSA
jgi:hypothetical protein